MIVVNYGGGTNSTALLVEAHRRGIRPDMIVFADTGGEMPNTYAFLEEMAAWCARVRFPVIDITQWVRVKPPHAGAFIPLERISLAQKTLPSKAYGLAGCSTKFKSQPIDRHVYDSPLVRAAWRSGLTVERWIGFDAGEPSRGERQAAKNPQPPHNEYGHLLVQWRAPLIEWGMDREACVAAIRGAGLSQPGKSSCFFCPSMKKHEIDTLAHEHPDLLARALHMEDVARPGLTDVKGLGRNFSWREYIEGKPEAMAARETVGSRCGVCSDGEEE